MTDSDIHKSNHDALVRAISKVGTVARFALKVGVSARTVHTWLYRKKGVPDRSISFVQRIEGVSGVPRHDLAAHVYPKPQRVIR